MHLIVFSSGSVIFAILVMSSVVEKEIICLTNKIDYFNKSSQ